MHLPAIASHFSDVSYFLLIATIIVGSCLITASRKRQEPQQSYFDISNLNCSRNVRNYSRSSGDGLPDPEQHVFTSFAWGWYRELPVTLKPVIEAIVLKLIISEARDASKPGLSFERCENLLAGEPELKEALLHCWESCSLEKLRINERFLSLVNTTGSYLSESLPTVQTKEEQNSDLPKPHEHAGIHGSAAENDLESVCSAGNSVTICNSAFTQVAGDVWNIKYTSSTHQDVAKWFSSHDYRPTHNAISKKRMENTGETLLKLDIFKNWCTTTMLRVLWCPGIPGAGKTVTASLVINYLWKFDKDKTYIGMVYFNYRQWAEQNLDAVLRSLARQAYELTEHTALHALYASHSKHQSTPSTDELKEALITSFQDFQTCYIILDALDEYLEEHSDKKISDLLCQLLSLGENVKITVTSRVVGGMTTIFKEIGASVAEISAERDDLTVYLEKRLEDCDFDFTLPEEVRRRIVEDIREAAGERYLMAELHMNAVANQVTLGDLKKTLSTLSREVDQTYAQAMVRILAQSQYRKELAMKILLWIVCGPGNLDFEALQHALATSPHISGSEITEFVPSQSTITSVCAGLVVIDPRRGRQPYTPPPRLVHFTAQEFFQKTAHEYFPHAHNIMSRTCLDYLSIVGGETPGELLKEDFPADLRYMYPFYDHACLSWGKYADSRDDALSNRIVEFLRGHSEFATLLSLYYIFSTSKSFPHIERWKIRKRIGAFWHWPDELSLEGTSVGVYLSLFHDQIWALNTLLESSLPESVYLTGLERTPLLYAVILEDVDLVQGMLKGPSAGIRFDIDDALALKRLASPLDMSHSDRYGRTALSYAAESNSVSIIRLLLEHGTDNIDSQDIMGWTPLSYAVLGGHEDVVDILLNHGNIDINSRDIDGRNPLMRAATPWGESVARRLLEHSGIDVLATDNGGRTALTYAISNGSKKTTERLLAHGTLGIDAPYDDGRTPVSHLAEEGRKDILQLLLDQGGGEVDLNSVDKEGMTPLMYGVKNNHLSFVELLVQQPETAMNLQNAEGKTALSLAAGFSSPDLFVHFYLHDDPGPVLAVERTKHEARALTMIEQLLTRPEVDLTIVDSEGRTALQAAQQRKRYRVVELLQAREGIGGSGSKHSNVLNI